MMTKQNRIVLLFLLLLVGTMPVMAVDYLLNISANDKGTVQVYQMNGVAIPNEGSVTAGEKYRVIATCSDENYLFDHLEVTGGNNLIVEDKEKGHCTFVVSGTGSVTVKAVFIGKPQTIELKAPEAGQGTYSVICNGKKIQDKGTVPYGSAVTVIAEPKEGYATKLVEVNNEEVPKENNKYIISKVTNDLLINVTFEKIRPVINFDKSTSAIAINVYAGEQMITSGEAVNFGTKITVETYSKSYAYLVCINNEFPQFEKINNELLRYVFVAKENTSIVINKKQIKTTTVISMLSKNVSFEYDGKPKNFPEYKVSPTNSCELKVQYKEEKDTDFSTNVPVEVGTYNVNITGVGNEYFRAPNSQTATLMIKQAHPIITSLPSAVFENDVFVLKNGSVEAHGLQIKGTFEFVVKPDMSGIFEVVFKPEDSKRYTEAKCCIPVSFNNESITRYRVKIATLPSNLSFDVMNMDAVVRDGDLVAKDTELKLCVSKLPKGKIVEDFIHQVNVEKIEIVSNVFKIEKDYHLSVILIDDPNKLPEISLNQSKVNVEKIFLGVPQTLSTSGIGNGIPGKMITANNWEISYFNKATNEKVIAPMNVGEYKMDLYYPSDGNYASFRGEGTFTITEGEPNAVFTNIQVSSVAEGQPLSFSSITGGVADVPGTFTWKDPSLKVYNGKEYEIVFTPADPNYKKMSAKVPVPVTTVPFLSFAPKNGTIRVVNKTTNQTLKSGDWLSVGDELVIKAQPSSGYTLQTLSVNSYSISNGSSYFVGDKPLTIEAVFEDSSVPSVPYYTVTIPEVTGAIISNTGTNSVKAGNSFSFVIDYDLLYGAPTVMAGGQKLAYDGSYTYTLTKVTQDTTVSISLPKYGHYTVTTSVDTTLARIDVKPIDAAMKAGTTGYAYGTELELTAIPANGVRFYSWWDGNTENPRIYRVRSNQKISANFRGTPTGIDSVAEALDIRSSGNNLYIQTDTECKARIIDMQGRMINQFMVSGTATYQVSQLGVYIVILYKENQPVLTKKIKIGQ